ncbi:MAG: hypothetical protein LUC87_02405 [Clostridiales bacterium]|nr:hypothetical protein [Clostridiales bacterium]
MKFVGFAALAALALWDLPALWRAGEKRAFAVWIALGAAAAVLMAVLVASG